LGAIGVQAERCQILANRRFSLILLEVHVAQIVVGLGVARFSPEGLLILVNCLDHLAFLKASVAEIVMGNMIVHCDRDRMPEKRFAILPIAKLLPRQSQAKSNPHHPA